MEEWLSVGFGLQPADASAAAHAEVRALSVVTPTRIELVFSP
jgi:hypothetical protein